MSENRCCRVRVWEKFLLLVFHSAAVRVSVGGDDHIGYVDHGDGNGPYDDASVKLALTMYFVVDLV